jgi:hypothetical protein
MTYRPRGAYVHASTPVLPVALAVLLVLIVFVGGSADAWAQYSFPYLGPNNNQAQIIQGAFLAQSRFFGGLEGTRQGLGFGPLQMLATLAALVGGIVIAFQRKHWTVPTLASWLLVVIITVFVPYGSSLLFYRVSPPDTNNLTVDWGNLTANLRKTTCATEPRGCGFTPQLVAIHIPSVMQLVVSDMFKSQGWTNLLEEITAKNELEKDPFFITTGDFYDKAKRFKERCSDTNTFQASLQSLMGNSAGAPGGLASIPSTQMGTIPRENITKVGAVWEELRQQFNAPGGVGVVPPPLMYFPDDTLAEKLPNELQTSYEEGITALYKTYVDSKKTVKIKKRNGGDLSITEALKELNEATKINDITASSDGVSALQAEGFFSARELGFLYPGFFFQYGSDYKNFNEKSNSLTLRQCYLSTVSSQKACLAWLGAAYNSTNNPTNHKEQFNQIDNFLKSGSEQFLPAIIWEKFAVLWKNPAFQNMPVLKVDFSVAATTPNSAPQVTPVLAGNPIDDCATIYASAINNLLDKYGNNSSNGNYTKPIKDILLGKTPLSAPEISKTIIPKLVCTSSGGKGGSHGTTCTANESEVKSLTYFVTTLNSELTEAEYSALANRSNSRTSLDRLYTIANFTMVQILNNTLTTLVKNGNLKNTNTAEDSAADAAGNLQVVGNANLTVWGGGLAFFLGKQLAQVKAFFDGATAQAYVGFLSIVVQLALLAMIALTPFLLIAGALMPGAALGILIIVTFSVFILQFLPITLMILNYLGGLIMMIIRTGGTQDAATMEAFLVMGMSGLYTGIIGVTMYLMFKLGDANAMLGNLTALDSAAKKAAETGIKAAIAVAAIGATAVLSGPFAAAGLLMRNAFGSTVGGQLADKLGGKKSDGSGPAPQPTAAEDKGSLGVDPANTDIGSQFLDALPQEEREAMSDALAGARATAQDRKHTYTGNENYVPFGPNNQFKAIFDQNGTLTGILKEDSAGSGTFKQFPPPTSSGPLTSEDVATDKTDLNLSEDQNAQARTEQAAGTTTSSAQQPGGGTGRAQKAIEENIISQQTSDAMQTKQAEWRASQILKANEKAEQAKTAINQNTKLTPDQKENQIKQIDEVLKATHAKIEATDFIGGDMSEILTHLNKFNDLVSQRMGADIAPGFGATVLSGFLGGFKAAVGGAGGIPIIGDILKNSFNEYYEGAERARSWKAAGGFWKSVGASGDAERKKFYELHTSQLAPAAEYNEMLRVGGFQAKVDISRQTAMQSVAKMRSEYEALLQRVMNEKNITLDELQVGGVSLTANAFDYRGLGMVEAAKKIGDIRAESFLMQGESQRVLVYDKAQEKYVERDLKPNAAMLSRLYGDISVKEKAKYFDEAMVNWYGIVEKQFERAQGKWDATRAMSFDAKAAAKFAVEDVSTDYLVTGHNKMVEGKLKFLEAKDGYQKLVTWRNADSQNLDTRLEKEVKNYTGGISKLIQDVVKKERIFPEFKGKDAKQIEAQFKEGGNAYRREVLNKWLKASESLGGLGVVGNMDTLFAGASFKGSGNMERALKKARKAAEEEIRITINEQEKSVIEQASLLLKSTDARTIGDTKNSFKAYGAPQELMALRKNLVKSLQELGMNLNEAVKAASEITNSAIAKNYDVLDSYEAKTVGTGKNKVNAVTFNKADLDTFIENVATEAYNSQKLDKEKVKDLLKQDIKPVEGDENTLSVRQQKY